MSVNMSTNAIHYKAGHAYTRLNKKRSSSKQKSQKAEEFLRPDFLDIRNRSGIGIMNSPPTIISEQPMLRSSIVRRYVEMEEQSIWRYLLRPGKFFFMWLLFSLLAVVGMGPW